MTKTRFARPARIWDRGTVLAAALVVASPALATETYTFDKAHTTVGFQIRHFFTMVGGPCVESLGGRNPGGPWSAAASPGFCSEARRCTREGRERPLPRQCRVREGISRTGSPV